jgi:hypothetical protein
MIYYNPLNTPKVAYLTKAYLNREYNLKFQEPYTQELPWRNFLDSQK